MIETETEEGVLELEYECMPVTDQAEDSINFNIVSYSSRVFFWLKGVLGLEYECVCQSPIVRGCVLKGVLGQTLT